MRTKNEIELMLSSLDGWCERFREVLQMSLHRIDSVPFASYMELIRDRDEWRDRCQRALETNLPVLRQELAEQRRQTYLGTLEVARVERDFAEALKDFEEHTANSATKIVALSAEVDRLHALWRKAENKLAEIKALTQPGNPA